MKRGSRPALAHAWFLGCALWLAGGGVRAEGVAGHPEVGAGGSVLELAEVLRSVEAHHPRIRMAVERARRAEAELMAARGGFDPQLNGRASARSGGYYEIRRMDVELSQPTALWGTELFAGYRLGLGFGDGNPWPSYLPDETLAGGEVRAGVRIPLWRNGPIDERRARLEGARHLTHAAQQMQHLELFELRLAATRAYWQWIAAGQAYAISEALWKLALERTQQLEAAYAAGAVPAIDITDNTRMVLERDERRVAARRLLERAGYDLALFLRDAQGAPMSPPPARLPAELPPPVEDPLSVYVLAERVLACHPQVLQLQAELRALGVDVRLAANRVGPLVLGNFQVSRDLGDPARNYTLAGTAVETGVMLSMPLPLRQERGQLGAIRARRAEKQAELTWLLQRLEVEIADVASRVQAARERVQLAAEAVEKAAELAEAERRRLRAGASNLIFVNVREQAAADARMRLLEATAETHLAWAQWENYERLQCERG